MRYSHLFFALVLSFSLQIALASTQDPQDSIIGEWSNPNITTNIGGFCCVPTSITIENKSLDSYAVTYNYPGFGENGYDAKCHMFFDNKTNGTMTISRGDLTENHRSDHSITSMILYFQALELGLNVFNKPHGSMIESEACQFTMTSRNALRPFKVKYDRDMICMIVFVTILLIALLIGFQKRIGSVLQRNRANRTQNNVIINNSDVTPNPDSSESQAQTLYVAPGQFMASGVENNA